jgi:hypothetical protein
VGLRGLAAISDGTLTTDEFREEILRHYRQQRP